MGSGEHCQLWRWGLSWDLCPTPTPTPGDPNKVTVFSNSAGSFCAYALYVSPQCQVLLLLFMLLPPAYFICWFLLRLLLLLLLDLLLPPGPTSFYLMCSYILQSLLLNDLSSCTCPCSQGLFHRVIAQSGPLTSNSSAMQVQGMLEKFKKMKIPSFSNGNNT